MTDADRRSGTLVLTVPGLSCRPGVRLISRHVSDLPGVVAFAVDLEAATVTVRGDVTVEAVRDAVAAAGYAVSPVAV